LPRPSARFTFAGPLLVLYAYGLASAGSSGMCGAAEAFLFEEWVLLPQGVLEGQLR
jgi:hypothetical protein